MPQTDVLYTRRPSGKLCFYPFPQTAVSKYEATKQKRKFSSFFKSLVIELDKDLYGPDNHLVEVRPDHTFIPWMYCIQWKHPSIVYPSICNCAPFFIFSEVIVVVLQWHRTATTQETDGFQVKRPGDVGVRCTVLLMLDYQVSPPGACISLGRNIDAW